MKKIKNQQGFSLLEIAVSLGIISIALLGIFALSIQSIKTQSSNKSELAASMLAQEGIELVRNIRDENWLTVPVVAWDKDINTLSDETFIIDTRGRSSINDVPDVFSDASTILNVDSSGFYSYDIGSPSKYKRLITVTKIEIDGGPEYYLKVTSKVEWYDSGRKNEYVAETLLYDWR